MIKNRMVIRWIAGVLASLALCSVAWAVLPTMQGGEQVQISLTKLLDNIRNAAAGSILYTAGRDDWRPLAASTVDNYVLTFDTATGLPFWAAPSLGPTGSVLYSSLTESAAHTGATAAETVVMPASAEGTAATDIGAANMLAGAVLEYQVYVDATGDADGDETLTVNVYFGTQIVGTSGAIAIDGATDMVITGTVNLEAAGASVAGNYFSINNSYPGVATTTAAPFTAFNTTTAKAFAVKLDWGGTTDAADTAKVQMAELSVNNFD